MANQENYQEPLPTTNRARPSRLTDKDNALVSNGNKPAIFGETVNDVVEIYLYDDSGNVVTHLNLRPTAKEVTLTKRVSELASNDFLNLDLASAFQSASVLPGRYSMTVNFFRDEVGSEDTYKMYIADISPSRTELRLVPTDVTAPILKDIYEFTDPSISPSYAQALTDQIFGKSLNFTDAETITLTDIEAQLNFLDSGSLNSTITRLNLSNTSQAFYSLITTVTENVRNRVLDIIEENSSDREIQNAEYQAYLAQAINDVLTDMQNKGQIDPHFKLV